jgi:Gas vesicle synthesis protein GvpL/GvpF/Lsr2
MASVTQVTRTCDVCGKAEDVKTWTFGLDGKAYEIDLCRKDRDALGKVTARYIAKARKVTARPGHRRHGGRPRPQAANTASDNGTGAPRTKASGRGRGTGSTRKEAGAIRPTQSAATVSGAKARAANSERAAKASHVRSRKTDGASTPAAKAADARQRKGIYVYGILPADIEVAADVPGVGEHPGLLRDVRVDGLAALISEVDLSGQLGSPEDLRTYREILDSIAAEVPVLPMRFGTVLTSEDAVAEELLGANHDEFTAALERLEGRAEFQVKGRYVEAVVAAKREEDTRTLRHALDGVSVASVAREPVHELDSVHVAFLVAVDQEGEVERVIEDLAREWEGRIDLQLLGPMAAYDFTRTTQPVSGGAEAGQAALGPG